MPVNESKIEWTDSTWSPVTGCSKVSQGCKNCYAERIAERFWKNRKFTEVRMHPERLDQPLKWRKPRKIFVNSMADLFHESVTDIFISQIFDVIEKCPQHIFQILTKRPARMYGYYIQHPIHAMKNVWTGISCEDQATADERIPFLLQTPAAIRFISAEPLLGKIDLTKILYQYVSEWINADNSPIPKYLDCLRDVNYLNTTTGKVESKKISWVIVGSESGPHARPCEEKWIREIKNQCVAADVPFFYKQFTVNGKKIGTPELDGKKWIDFPILTKS